MLNVKYNYEMKKLLMLAQILQSEISFRILVNPDKRPYNISEVSNCNKVNRCLARYSPRATTTSQPTNRAPNKQAMVRNANFGPNWVVFGQKILFLLEKSKVLLLT